MLNNTSKVAHNNFYDRLFTGKIKSHFFMIIDDTSTHLTLIWTLRAPEPHWPAPGRPSIRLAVPSPWPLALRTSVSTGHGRSSASGPAFPCLRRRGASTGHTGEPHNALNSRLWPSCFFFLLMHFFCSCFLRLSRFFGGRNGRRDVQLPYFLHSFFYFFFLLLQRT